MSSSVAGGDPRGSREVTHCLRSHPLQVTSFKYLGRVLTAEENDWPAVVRNLRRARQKWARMTRVLSREGADDMKLEHIYLAVAQ